jgi:hypothetical protein
MSTSTRHVDHLVLPVADLDTAAAEFHGAGYIVTPRADHPFGTSNRLVVFTDTYLELVAVTNADQVPEAGFAGEVAAYVADQEGISHVVVSSEDAGADFAALAAAGVNVRDPFDFSRPAPIADGTTMTASFSLVPTESSSPLGAFVCVHHTKEAVWHPSHLEHPNGARRIRAISVAARAPELFDALEVEGIGFAQQKNAVTTDGAAPAVRIGTVEILTLSAGRAAS